ARAWWWRSWTRRCHTSIRGQAGEKFGRIAVAAEDGRLEVPPVLRQRGDDAGPAVGREIPDVAQELGVEALRAAGPEVAAHSAVAFRQPPQHAPQAHAPGIVEPGHAIGARQAQVERGAV